MVAVGVDCCVDAGVRDPVPVPVELLLWLIVDVGVPEAVTVGVRVTDDV